MPEIDPFFGDPALLSDAKSNLAKGNLVRARIRYVRGKHGDAAVAEVASRLTPSARETFLNPPLVSDWVPFTTLMEIDRRILEGPMCGDFAEVRRLGVDVAAFDIPSLYSAFLKRLSTPAFLMNRIHLLYKLYIRDGMAEGKSDTPGLANVTLWNGVLPYYFCNWGITGWLEGALGLYQAKNIEAIHPVCRHKGASVCQWELRWD